MVRRQSTLSLGLAALTSMASFSTENVACGFVQPRTTSVPSALVSSRSSLHMSVSRPNDDSKNNWDQPLNDMETSSQIDYGTDQYSGNNGAFPLPSNIEVPETRQLRWEREALVQSKFSSGDDLFALRRRTMLLGQDLIDARVQYNDSGNKDDQVAVMRRINALDKELVDLNGRDAEFMYAVSRELMEKAEADGDERNGEKHRVQMEEARLCIPQLNMHGLWVGKYGEYGYEMINVTYAGDSLVATKVTGDKNVPKGEVTFTVDLTPQISSNGQATHLEPIELDSKAEKQWGKKYLPRHVGQGQVASENFTNAQWMEGQMIVVGRFFSFAWVPIGHQIFFGRPSSELTLKMLREAKDDELKRDHVAVMRDAAMNMMEETYWSEKEDDQSFGGEGCFE